MGFMDRLNQQQRRQQVQSPNLSNLLQQAKQIVGDDPRAALAKMQTEGATVNLPNGKIIPVQDVVKMAEGKSALQFLTDLMQ